MRARTQDGVRDKAFKALTGILGQARDNRYASVERRLIKIAEIAESALLELDVSPKCDIVQDGKGGAAIGIR